MPTFSYIATTKDNKTVTGTIEASAKDTGMQLLKKEGLRPISLKEAGSKKSGRTTKGSFLRRKHVKATT